MASILMTSEYHDLSYMIGREVNIIKGMNKLYQYRLPEEAKIVAEYPKTVLLEMTYIKSDWGMKYSVPRKIMKMIPKAIMACGDVILQDMTTGIYLIGEEVSVCRERYNEWEKKVVRLPS